VPPAVIAAVLTQQAAHEQRVRKFTMTLVVWGLIAMNCYTHLDIGHVLRKLTQGSRFLRDTDRDPTPTAGAFSYRRYQLGARPLVALFHAVCRPLATPATRGAWLCGLRLMAFDGTTEDVPDTPANAATFGRHTGSRGASAFPQVQGMYLVECGTHAIVEAGFWPCQTSEHRAVRRLVRAVTPDMLVMYDRGLHSFDLVCRLRQRGAHVLGRVPTGLQPTALVRLADGSQLVRLRPADAPPQHVGVVLRLIEYTLDDPALPGYGARHRLLTSLLDPQRAPAVELACAYHERWEIELVIDEVDTHQRLAGRLLRSQKPVGVIQELYALLIAHYVVRAVMHETALDAGVDPDRLSFVGALRVLHDAIPEFALVAPQEWARLYTRVRREIAQSKQLPARRLRSNPRVVKRKMSKFPLKRLIHQQPPQPTKPFREAILLI
jgi:Insertion element 4 transposase N-terminal/Transposase DDE domain